jgi:hypothetical protein
LVGLGSGLWGSPESTQHAGSIASPWFFEHPLQAVGDSPLASQEAAALALAIQSTAGQELHETASLLEAFTQENPSSVWTPSLRANLGRYYWREGAYTKALAHLEAAWEAAKSTGSQGKPVADYALANWTRLLVDLGRLDELDAIFSETAGRTLDAGPLQQRFLRSQEMYRIIKHTPSSSYRCGWLVLGQLSAAVRGQGPKATNEKDFYNESNLFQSCSMQSLVQLAQAEQWSLVAVERPAGAADLPVPSLMHLSQGHYIALLGAERGLILAYDPIFGRRHFRPEVLNSEASGRFLVAVGQIPQGWSQLSVNDSAATVGRSGWFAGYPDNPDRICEDSAGSSGLSAGNPGDPGLGGPSGNPGGGNSAGNSSGGCGNRCKLAQDAGMVQWTVTEPTINLWLTDTPITCQPAYGPAVGFKLAYKQRDDTTYVNDVFSFGASWHCQWLSWVDNYYYQQYHMLGGVDVYLPGGGRVSFTLSPTQLVATEYYYNTRLTAVVDGNGVPTAFVLDFPDGRQCIYQQPWKNQYFYMTASVDRQGFATQFSYGQVTAGGVLGLRLTSVLDQAGGSLYTLQYVSLTGWPHLVQSVTDRFSRSAQLGYQQDLNTPPYTPHLQQITDAQSMVSSMTYDGTGLPQTLSTPYGTTTFTCLWGGDPGTTVNYRWIKINEPNGGNQVYAFAASCYKLWNGDDWMLNQYFDPSLVPANLPAGTTIEVGDTAEVNSLNSFHWDQNQAANISHDLATPSLFTVADMQKARMRHWLDGGGSPDLGLSIVVHN